MKTKVRRAPTKPAPEKEISLIPVRLTPIASVGVGHDGVRDIQIRFDDGKWIVGVPSGVDSTHLTKVLKAISSASQ